MGKPSLSVPDLVSRLTSRGLIDSRGELKRALLDHGYYRLSGYWRYYQVNPASGANSFVHGSDFADVFEVYRQDAVFRNLLGEGLSEVEIALRAVLTAFMCKPGGDGTEFRDATTYIASRNDRGDVMRDYLLADIAADIDRSKERHVVHYRTKDPAKIPMWVATEALSFGTLSRMYGLLADSAIRDSVAARFGYRDGLTAARFAANLRSVVVLRNVCAHQGRIWNRHVRTDVPYIPRSLIAKGFDALHYRNTTWGVAAVTAHLVSAIRRDSSFQDEVNAVAAHVPGYRDGLTAPQHK